jgi:hypothetical protein
MFGWFRKSETPEQLAVRQYRETMETFSKLNIIRTLALMHRTAMQGGSEADWEQLVVGAWRTVELAAELVTYRVEREGLDEGWVNASRGAIYKGALMEIAQTIKESDPRPRKFSVPDCTVEEACAMRERSQLRDAAVLLDQFVRQRRLDKSFEVWRACAKGAYMDLPMIYASSPPAAAAVAVGASRVADDLKSSLGSCHLALTTEKEAPLVSFRPSPATNLSTPELARPAPCPSHSAHAGAPGSRRTPV